MEINGISEQGQSASIKTASRIGFVKTFAGTTPPEGTLLCDGSAVSRNTYSELFAAIGTTWGSGDGANTFNLPDLRDVWILCAGTEHEAGESVAEGLPNITGYITEAPDQALCGSASGAFAVAANHTNYAPSGAIRTLPVQISFNASRSSSIYGASTHVTPASVAVLPCIVYE